jgi:hypothetical protein
MTETDKIENENITRNQIEIKLRDYWSNFGNNKRK